MAFSSLLLKTLLKDRIIHSSIQAYSGTNRVLK